ncbi:DsrE family protein [Roseateles sp. DXS20W]
MILGALLCVGLALGLCPLQAAAQTRALYHVGEGDEQAKRALLFINNHLQSDPAAEIALVAHADGVQFLLHKAGSETSADFAKAVSALLKTGRVKFMACGITLANRGIDAKNLFEGVAVVRSGVLTLADLQNSRQFAYIRP